VPRQETSNADTIDVVRQTRSALAGTPESLGVSGVGPLQLDYQAGVYGNFPYVILVIVVITFLLLMRAFRSILLPLKAVLLNLLSLAATFGGLVLFWQWGHGSNQVFGIAPTGSITFWLPVMIFAFLFGLSMDYEVFILSRIREEYDQTGDTDAAVVTGLGRTGRLVTSAALILFLAFISLASGPQTDIKVFATGLGFGILLDATVVRMLLVPALVSMFGRWNWYMPGGVARALRMPVSAEAEEAA
jgi:putative drug exporter of the RND superfamily